MEIELDLLDLANKKVDREGLETLLTRLEFESILKYVKIPRYTLQEDPNLGRRGKNGTQPRRENELIFDILRSKRVQKIIRVIVEDGTLPSHRDEAIERILSGFDVEEWDWKKVDLCSDVVLRAAENTRELYLYSSGNNAVLRSWSAEDGLGQLQKVRFHYTSSRLPLIMDSLQLKVVRASVTDKLEGLRTRNYMENFIRRMEKNLPNVDVEIHIEREIQHEPGGQISRRRSP